MTLNYAQIDSLIESLLDNAKALIFEAETLNSVSAYARAFALAHLAREEISKCGILHAAGTRLLAGIEVDWKKTMRRLRDHKAKLELETVNQFLFVGAESKLAAVPSIVEHRNDRKNAAIYVGLINGKAVLPSQVFTENQAARTIELAKFALETEEKIRLTVGQFVARTPGPIRGLPDLNQLTPEQMKELIERVGPSYKLILQKLFATQTVTSNQDAVAEP
ncbi:AbiV family abortive infection protein [Oxalobacteraceae bacterium OTU3REALA1]|nr:AbiV family abortive infection protein [Oxalobacteraceae bacterium OTU3REALA1]